MSTSKSSNVLTVRTTMNGKSCWIKLFRNNQYIPYDRSTTQPNQTREPTSNWTNGTNWTDRNTRSDRPIGITPSPSEDSDEWHVVSSKKKPVKIHIEQPIYYWVVCDHNLCDKNDRAYRLFFTDVDMTQIENNDQNNHMAIDKDQQLRLIHVHLKHKGMKMTPTFYIARNIKQIEDALQYVKYCVVKTECNVQKLLE